MFNNWRKLILTQPGIVLISVLSCYLISSALIANFHDLIAIVASLVSGIILGIIMWDRLGKDQAYFIQNVKNDKYHDTQIFNKMFKKAEVPSSKTEKVKFLKYLDAIEKVHSRNIKQVGSLIFLTAILVLTIITDRKLDFLNIGFALLVVFAYYGWFRSRRALEKIRILRARLVETH